MTFEEYIQLALRTESPRRKGENIPARLAHSIDGLACETLELMLATAADEGQIEEIGDLYWFTALGYDVLKGWAHIEQPQHDLVYHVEKLCSMKKAHTYYGKFFNYPDALGHLMAVKIALDLLCKANGYTGVLEANIAKLRQRYPKAYSDECAISRDTTAEFHAMQEQVQRHNDNPGQAE